MRVKITDVAKKAGVSPSTVSLVMNNKNQNISEETSNRVRKIAKELNYRPNEIARSLVGMKSNIITLVIPDLLNQYYNQVSKVVIATAKKRGYRVILLEEDLEENDVHKLFSSQLIAGALIMSNKASLKAYTDKEFQKYNIVFLDDVYMDENISYVSGNNTLGGYLVADYLLKHGHKEFTCIKGPEDSYNTHYRLEGFLKRLAEDGIEEEQVTILDGDYSFEAGYQASYKIEGGKRQAIFCLNDMMAHGLIKGVQERGICICPNELSIIGYDNLEMSRYMQPGLTTVEQDISSIGKNGLNHLIDLIEEEKTEAQHIIIDPYIVEGETVFYKDE